MQVFKNLLLDGKISRPDEGVLEKISAFHHSELLAYIDSKDRALFFYQRMKELPSTSTKNIVREQTGVEVNGPISEDKPKLLSGVSAEGVPIVLKLLFPGTDDPRSLATRNQEIEIEKQTCIDLKLGEETVVALVPSKVVELHVDDLLFQRQTGRSGTFAALLMPRYLYSIARGPRTQKLLAREGRRMVDALLYMHDKEYVHMDVKADNIFVDNTGCWFLGDFGSACKFGTLVHSTTSIFYPENVLRTIAVPKYDWFMLLVMLLIEINGREGWSLKFIKDKEERVDYELIMAEQRRVSSVPSYSTELRDLIADITRMYASS